MIVEYIRYEVTPVRHQEFIASYKAAAVQLDAAGQCLAYEISQGAEEPNHFMVRIEWRSIEEHEQGFRKSRLFADFFAEVKPFFSEIREMKHYHVIQRGKPSDNT
jgi:quinol monooxygenase YgiN